MFRSIWSKTLREYCLPALCWGIGLGLILFVTFTAYSSIAQDPASQASFQQLVQTFRFYAEPIAINTPEGFITWRSLGIFVPAMLSIWALLAGARLVRGEEERGSMDLLLSTPASRTRLLLEKIGALVVALLFIAVLTALGVIAGEAQSKIEIRLLPALLCGLNVGLFAFFIAMLALLLSQFLRNRGAAAGWTGGVLVLSVLLDGTGRTVENGAWIQRFSPLFYYNANKPLVASYEGHPWAALLLLGLTLVFIVLSWLLFAWRDIGGMALTFRRKLDTARSRHAQRAMKGASGDLSCRGIALRALRAQLGPAFWWLLGLGGYVAWITALLPSLIGPLQNILAGNPALKVLFSQTNTNTGLLATVVFQFAPLLSVLFVLTQALTWSNDLDSGRLELVLSTPIARWRLLLERFGALFLFALLAPLLIWGAVSLSTRLVNVSVDNEKIAAAALGILPLEMLIAAFVYAVAARLRSSAILGLVTLYLVLSFLSEMFISLLKLPDWVMSLSIFHAYGSPATEGWRWGPWGIMLGIALILLIAGIAQFQLADVDRGAA
jgi:ABC-2 type transport system permease protein